MKLNDLALDTDLEEGGIWIPVAGDFEVRVVSTGSKRGKAAYRKHLRPVERKIEVGALKEDDANIVMGRYLGHGLVVDWRGADDDDGNPIPFTPEVASREFARADLRHVRDRIIKVAGEPEAYRMLQLAEDADALKADSAGNLKRRVSSTVLAAS